MISIYNSLGQVLSAFSTPTQEVIDRIKEEQTALGNFYIEDHVEPDLYYIADGIPVEMPPRPSSYYFFNYETKLWEPDLAIAGEIVKSIRNQKLQESDWTDTVSAQTRLGETLYNAWQDYRQQLRDIPLQSGYPLEVIYPEPPVS
jgi:hypothetical protein